jgi:hypothetical protein
MTTRCVVSVYVTFELDTPVTLNGLTGTRVRWVLIHENPDQFPETRPVSFAFLHGPLEGTERQGVEVEVDGRLPDPLPDWLPTPPAGWDVSSRLARFRARGDATAATVMEVEATVRFHLDTPTTFDGSSGTFIALRSSQRLPDDGLPVILTDPCVDIYGTDERDLPAIVRLAADASVPVGIPEPPAGWDAHVRAFRTQFDEDVQ